MSRFATPGSGKRIAVKRTTVYKKDMVVIQKEHRYHGSDDWQPGKGIGILMADWDEVYKCLSEMNDAILEERKGGKAHVG